MKLFFLFFGILSQTIAGTVASKEGQKYSQKTPVPGSQITKEEKFNRERLELQTKVMVQKSIQAIRLRQEGLPPNKGETTPQAQNL